VKLVNGAKHEDLEEALVIWTLQVNAKNGTASEEVMRN
jgi:hypothetical protein